MTYKHIFTEQSRECQRVPTGGWLMSEKGPQDGKRKNIEVFGAGQFYGILKLKYVFIQIKHIIL